MTAGGFHGLFTLRVLELLEKYWDEPLQARFEVFAGSSVGSIAAASLAFGATTESALAQFKNNGSRVFPKHGDKGLAGLWHLSRALGSPRYQVGPLKAAIASVIPPEAKMRDAEKLLVIPAYNVSKGRLQVFTGHSHPKLLVTDAILAACAVPSYFPLHAIGSDLFIDGAVNAAVPDEVALQAAMDAFEVEEDSCTMLSIGTATSNGALPKSFSSKAGALQWVQESRLMMLMLGAQQQVAVENMQRRMANQYSRIDSDEPVVSGMDDASPAAAEALLRKADSTFASWRRKNKDVSK
jgi:uncharacterized protein